MNIAEVYFSSKKKISQDKKAYYEIFYVLCFMF